MMRVTIIVVLSAFICSLGAYSLLDSESGNRVYGGDARLLAMGEAGMYNRQDAGAVWLNPATAAFLQKGLTMQFSSGILMNSEDRSIPMYNFFDGYIDDANYVSNTHGYQDLLGRINYRQNLDNFSLALSAGWQPTIDFNSEYQEQVRNDGNSDSGNSGDNSPNGYPPIIARNYLESAGSLGGISLNLAASWQDVMSLGVSVQQLAGDWQQEQRIEWTDAARELADEELPDSEMMMEGDFDAEYRLGFGAAYQINERIGVGFAMQPKMEMTRTIKGSIDGLAAEEVDWDTLTVNGVLDTLSFQDMLNAEYSDYVLPGSYRIGLQYHPRNMWNTYLNFDLEYVQYSDVNEKFSDVTNYYLGVEHRVNQKLPLRFGFNYKTSYHIFEGSENEFAQKVTMPGFTAGTGFAVLQEIAIDLGVSYSLRKYEQLDLFGDSYYDREGLWNEMTPADRGWDNPDQVDESLITLQASITWHWQVK